MALQVGVFDHLDRGRRDIAELYRERLELIAAYDRAGFHAYHLAEHHATSLGMAPCPGVFLSAAAQRTKRLRLGPMLYVLPLHEPLRLIEEICMLDHLSEGRLELGIGKGYSPFESAYFGVGHLDAPGMFEEAKSVILKGLTSESLSFAGVHYRYTDVPMVMRPRQTPHPPLWQGVASVSSAARAGAESVNIITNGPTAFVKPVIEAYRAAFDANVARINVAPKLGLARHVHVAETDSLAEASARRAYAVWYDANAELWRRFQTESFVFAKTYDEAIARGVAFVGSPETVAGKIKEAFAATGANYLVGRFAFGDLTVEEVSRCVRLFETRIMPRF